MLEILSRVQFALTVGFHFIFVPMSIGIILLVAIYEIKHNRTKDDRYRKLADFYGNLFIVNYAIGIVTGIAMSIQFGTNWGEYSKFMGDVFGTPLALEALIAFFLESTFTGIFVFRRHKMTPKFRMITALLILLGTSISSLWIITANGFMQNPVGFELAADGSRVILTDLVAVLTNPYVWYMLLHTVVAACLLGAFFVLAVSSYKLLKSDISEEEIEIHGIASKTAAKVAFVSSLLLPIIGERYMRFIMEINPAKFNAFLGNYQGYAAETTKLVQETGIDTQPMREALVQAVNIGFLIMVGLGTFFIIFSFLTIVLHKRYMQSATMKKIYLWTLITPYIAILAGWFIAESGRQPWVVYGLMPTKNAISQVPVSVVWFSIILTCLLYAVLFFVIFYLSKKQADIKILDIKYTNPKGGK